MTNGLPPLRNWLFLLAGLAALAGCSFEMPSFVGREGGEGYYSLGGDEEVQPEPEVIPFQTAVLEPALNGVILRVTATAPTWGYHTAFLRPLNNGEPDAAGLMTYELVAIPPIAAEQAGPPRSRQMSAGIFVPNLAMKKISGFRVTGGGKVQTLPAPRA